MLSEVTIVFIIISYNQIAYVQQPLIRFPHVQNVDEKCQPVSSV